MPTRIDDVAHLLRRAGFGGSSAEINELAKLDLSAIVDRLLNATPPPVDAPPAVAAYEDDRYKAGVTMTQWWLDRMATTPAPLIEKMTLFWHGHFVSSLDKVDVPQMWEQQQLFRNKGLGSFTELCQAMALGPAMLHYLDNRTNRAKKRNENFARELMELFTIGVGNYNQADVVASARAWTGHGLSEDESVYVFMPDKHDNGTKTFLGITKNWDGPDIINELCTGKGRLLTARLITRKLWEFFAYTEPSKGLVDSLALQFANSQLDIKSLLRAIFQRSEFYSDTAKQGHVRSPIEYIVAVRKATSIPMSEIHPEWFLESMGQRPFYPPNVAGWKGDKTWITTSALWAKGNLGRRISWIDNQDHLLKDTKTQTVEAAVQRALTTFGIDKPSKTTRSSIEAAVRGERAAKGYNERQMLIVLTMLSPEFQTG